jgi:hypothetical protein
LGESAETLGFGLFGIDFPGVNIEVDGTSGAFDLFEPPTGKPPWEDTEVSTATDWDSQGAFGQDGDRVFRDGFLAAGKGIGV